MFAPPALRVIAQSLLTGACGAVDYHTVAVACFIASIAPPFNFGKPVFAG